MTITATYPIVSTDSHVNEPMALYRERVPVQYRDRVDEEVINMVMRPTKRPGYNPKFPEEIERLKAEAHGGRWQVEDRIKDQDLDGVTVDMIYPTRGLQIPVYQGSEFQLAMARAYNDWAHENFGAARKRFCPAAVIPPEDIDGAITEIYRVAKLGFKTVFMPAQVPDLPYNRPAYDPLWNALEDVGLPVSFHIGSGHNPRGESGPGGAVINYTLFAQGDGPLLAAYFCASGVLMKHPNLQIVAVESGASWVAWIMNAMDEAYEHHFLSVRDFETLDLLPSEYFKRQGHACFMYDPPALANIRFTGSDCLMWGNDYPHREATWPTSDAAIAEQFADVSEADKRKILGGNAVNVYKLDV